jgi:hypothetical protein
MVVRIMDKKNTIFWRVETPNQPIEATSYQKRIGNITTRYLRIVSPLEYKNFLVEETFWINCTASLQEVRKLPIERIKQGEVVSDKTYISLVISALPKIPLPTPLSNILHVQTTSLL